MSAVEKQLSNNVEIESSKVTAEKSSKTLLYILIGIVVIFVIMGIIFFRISFSCKLPTRVPTLRLLVCGRKDRRHRP